jgi:hypothetical protein
MTDTNPQNLPPHLRLVSEAGIWELIPEHLKTPERMQTPNPLYHVLLAYETHYNALKESYDAAQGQLREQDNEIFQLNTTLLDMRDEISKHTDTLENVQGKLISAAVLIAIGIVVGMMLPF